MSNLQPCEATSIQLKRSNNYFVKIWKSCASARCDYPDAYRDGWNVDFKLINHFHAIGHILWGIERGQWYEIG